MKKNFKNIIIFLLSFLIFTGCATKVKTTVKRPAELDLQGANKISVLPIQTEEFLSDTGMLGDVFKVLSFFANQDVYDPEVKIAEYVTNQLNQRLLAGNYFDVVSPTSVEVAIKEGRVPPTDVYLTGYINNFYTDLEKEKDVETVTSKNSVGEKVTKKIYKDIYRRIVDFSLVIEIYDADESFLITRQVKNFRKESSYYDEKNSVPSSLDLVESSIDSFIKSLMKKLQPYEVSKTITLQKDKTKSEAMKEANKLAKDGYISLAQEKYMNIFLETGLYEAGFNAAVLYQAMGNLDDAELLMTRLYKETGSTEVADALADIKKEKAYAEKLQEQLELKEILR